MAKPFVMYSYSNKILKNLPPPPRQPIMFEVKAPPPPPAEERGILIFKQGDHLWTEWGESHVSWHGRWVGPWYRRRYEYYPVVTGKSPDIHYSARRDVYENEIRKIFNDYTTPAEELNNKYNRRHTEFTEHEII